MWLYWRNKVGCQANDTTRFNSVKLLWSNQCWTLFRLVETKAIGLSPSTKGNLLNGIGPSFFFSFNNFQHVEGHISTFNITRYTVQHLLNSSCNICCSTNVETCIGAISEYPATSFTYVSVLWRSRSIAIVAILIRWHVNEVAEYSEFYWAPCIIRLRYHSIDSKNTIQNQLTYLYI